MRESIKQFVKIVAEVLPISEPIFEFGSLQVPGQENFADLRPFFPGKEYVGADLRGGAGVDRILNLHSIDLPSESVGAVLIIDTLEHVEFPRKAIEEACRILKPNGILVISSVMNFPIHDYPSDYWRFTPEAFKSLLKPFASSFVDFAGDEQFPHTVTGIGFKGSVPENSMKNLIKKLEDWKNQQSELTRKTLFYLIKKGLQNPLKVPGFLMKKFNGFSITQKGGDRPALQWTKEMWNSGIWKSITWLGVPILQWPTDLIILQEIVCEQKPQFIVEAGTAKGGSAIFFASLLKLLNIEGKIISIDKYLTEETKRLIESHPMGRDVILLKGNSVSQQTIEQIKQIVKDEKNIMVFLDSDHSYQHVLSELNHYQHFVPLGGYLCVFDTIMKDLYDMPNGEKSWRADNPHRAVMDFLKENDCFEIDKSRNRLLVGFGPDSFLKRVKA